MRHILVSGLNGYMSCGSVLTNWVQVWFNSRKNSSNMEICPNIENLCWTVMIAMFEWSKPVVLAWNLVFMLCTYDTSCCRNLMTIG